MVTFQQAYEAAAARYPRGEWDGLSPAQRIKALYEEMRRLDAETAAAMVDVHLMNTRASVQTATETVGMTDGSIVRHDDPPDRVDDGCGHGEQTLSDIGPANGRPTARRRVWAAGTG